MNATQTMIAPNKKEANANTMEIIKLLSANAITRAQATDNAMIWEDNV
jgi:hypothetical protein